MGHGRQVLHDLGSAMVAHRRLRAESVIRKKQAG